MRVPPRIRAVGVLCLIALLPAWAGGSVGGFRAHAGASSVSTSTRERTTWDSVFTADQAGRGETTYKRLCARCHMETLAGGDEAVELTGSAFMSSWNGQTLADLHDRIRTTMPTDTAGIYDRRDVTDVIAHMLRFNGFPAGASELTHENDALAGIRFVSSRP